jgi:glycine dehydrogenase
MVIRAYHQSRGDHHRNIADSIISSRYKPCISSNGWYEVVVTKTLENGNIDIDDLREKPFFTKIICLA